MTREHKELEINKAIEDAGEFSLSFTTMTDEDVDKLYEKWVGKDSTKEEYRPYRDIIKVNERTSKKYLGYMLYEKVDDTFCVVERDAKQLAQKKLIQDCEIRNGEIVVTNELGKISDIELSADRFNSQLRTFNFKQEGPPLTADMLQQDRKIQTGHDEIKHIYNSLREAPQYPQGFRPLQNGRKKFPMNKGSLLNELRKIHPGEWSKVYSDGYTIDGDVISVHYISHVSGKVYDVWVKPGWSNS